MGYPPRVLQLACVFVFTILVNLARRVWVGYDGSGVWLALIDQDCTTQLPREPTKTRRVETIVTKSELPIGMHR